MQNNAPSWDDTVENADEPKWNETISPESIIAAPQTQEPIDPLSAAILKFAGGSQILDELSGLFEAGGSIVGTPGLGGPTKDIKLFEGDPRSVSEAYQQGRNRKRELLKAAEQQYPFTSAASEAAGTLASGFALPIGGAGRLSKIGTGATYGAMGGYFSNENPETVAEDTLTGSAIGSAIPVAGGIKNALFSPTTARVLTGMPEWMTERYIDRGQAMDKADSLKQVAKDVPKTLSELLKKTQEKGLESRKILENENVKVPRQEIITRLQEAMRGFQEGTTTSPVLRKIQEIIQKYTGGVDEVIKEGFENSVIPKNTRTFVGGSKVPQQTTRNSIEEILIPPTNTRTVVGGAKSPTQEQISKIQEQIISGIQNQIQPTFTRTVISKPVQSMISGGQVKSDVQDIGELLSKLKNENAGFPKSSGARLANKAYGNLHEALKSRSEKYAQEVAQNKALMDVLEPARKTFSTPRKTMAKLRGIGQDRDSQTFAADELQALENVLGGNFSQRIKDQLVLDAFTKAGTQGSRGVQLGGAIGSYLGPVGERAGKVAGGAADYYSRKVLKSFLNLNSLIPKLPPRYKADFVNSSNLALTHSLLLQNDPEYVKTVEAME